MSASRPRVGVVGHVEWIQFAVVAHVPRPGEIVHAREAFELAAGGGAVAAVQLARLAGRARFLTAVGDDEHGARAVAELRALGVDVAAAVRHGARTRRGLTYLDDAHERTITILDPRIVPHAADPLPWDALAGLDAVYVTGGDADAVRAARAARVLVVTTRALDVLREARIEADAIVFSAADAGERGDLSSLDPPPRMTFATRGARGGHWHVRGGAEGSWDPEPPPARPVDAYGSGDSFAAGLTYGLGAGMAPADAARLGACCGAACLTGRGPYAAQPRG
ncbi:MAG TPA: PfkB family carbohydrate kinase [Solirubrobacteraceae bacterium]|nr:PfkB family carbohydrate kinase [Solirubrobacteraceae bacterium]